jgi:two-component system chemotaxis sensor kinase CheA
MDDLLADFLAETREMLEAIGGEIVAWETDPCDSERLDAIFRFVHTVKGNCGFFDFPRLASLSHAAEDALAECRAGRREPDAELVSAVLAIIDRIGEMADAIESGNEFPASGDEALIAALSSDASALPITAEGAPDKSNEKTIGDSEAAGEAEQGLSADAEAAPSRSKPASQRSIRLTVDLLDDMMKSVSDLVLARNEMARRLREAGETPEVSGAFDRLSGIMKDVREGVTRMRMQRLEHLFGSFPRLVRDLSSNLNKQVMVDFEGGDVELDREMVELIRDPLTHIIRNAIDHGIETPAQRLKNGKREIGLLRFFARQSGNQISLVITDDGRGIDTDVLASKAKSEGLLPADELDQMPRENRLRLIFEPGLSTAKSVSSVSGRGVGMDVVKTNIEKLGGSIQVSSTPGEGTNFYLRLPLTLSIMPALTVLCDGQTFALPQSFVEEIVIGRSAQLEFATAGEQPIVSFRGRRVPCLTLQSILGLECTDPDSIDFTKRTLLFIRLATDEVFAISVDRVLDHEDVVVKPLPPAIMSAGLYAGTTLLDNGQPMMLLDITRIALKHGMLSDLKGLSAPREPDAKPSSDRGAATIQAMVFTGLDGRKRAVHLGVVTRIDTISGTALELDASPEQIVLDDRIVPLEGVNGPIDPEGTYRLLRLRDEATEVAYLASNVHDTTAISSKLTPAADQADCEGLALIDGEIVPVIDAMQLFARHNGMGSPQKAALICRLPSDNSWAATILKPLLSASGYRIASDAETEADVVIQLDESEVSADDDGSAVIRLRSDPDKLSETDGSIYRYDRQGLLAALRELESRSA